MSGKEELTQVKLNKMNLHTFTSSHLSVHTIKKYKTSSVSIYCIVIDSE